MENQLSAQTGVATSRHSPLQSTGPQGPHGVRKVRLTDKILKSLSVESGRKDRLIFDDECRGMAVRITAAGTRSFLVQWTDPATKKKMREALGVWGSITLEQARTATRSRLGDVAKGVDVLGERQKRKDAAEAARAEAALTLDALVEQWASLHLSSRRPRYAVEAQRAIRFAFADHLKRPAAKLTRAMVVDVLDRLARAGRLTIAGRTVAYGRACFSWARKRGKLAVNPFVDLPISAAKSERDRVLDDDEVAEVWATAGQLPFPFGPFFKIALLTLQRREEVAGMRWSELSPDLSLWRIPAARMKAGKAHDVHLAAATREVLLSIPRIAGQDLVFSTNGKTSISGFSRAKLQIDAAIAKARIAAGVTEAPEPWRLHDFRRTGVSKLAAMGFDSIVVDKLLAHQPSKLKGVASVYQRHSFAEERARALDAWAAHVAGDKADNVVKLARKA